MICSILTATCVTPKLMVSNKAIFKTIGFFPEVPRSKDGYEIFGRFLAITVLPINFIKRLCGQHSLKKRVQTGVTLY